MVRSIRFSMVVMLLLVSGCLKPWGTSEISVRGEKKQRTNFYGCLTTYQGSVISVDNLSIGGSQELRVYEKPKNSNHVKSAVSGNAKAELGIAQDAKEIPITVNPLTELVETMLRLDRIAQIRIDNHQQRWTYERGKGYPKQIFLEIVIVFNDAKSTEKTFLVNSRVKISCDGLSNEGAAIDTMHVPFDALTRLEIKGYCIRDEKGLCLPMPPQDGACVADDVPADTPISNRQKKKQQRRAEKEEAQQAKVRPETVRQEVAISVE
jgi:hypothetical protein